MHRKFINRKKMEQYLGQSHRVCISEGHCKSLLSIIGCLHAGSTVLNLYVL